MPRHSPTLTVLRSHRGRQFDRAELAHAAAAIALTLGLERKDGRVHPLSERSIRFYQSQELVDPPERDGRDGVYEYLQLLQVVALRRLQSDGYELAKVAELVRSGRLHWHSDVALEEAISTAASAIGPSSEPRVESRSEPRSEARVTLSDDDRAALSVGSFTKRVEVSIEIAAGVRLTIDPAVVPRHEQVLDRIAAILRHELADR